MKYWFGYLTAAIFGAITWVLMQFGEKFSTLVDMIYPYVSRLIQTQLADWVSSVSFCLWQLLAVLLGVMALASIVLMIIFRWNFFPWLGWVLACACTLFFLHTGFYGLNNYAGPLAEDIRLSVIEENGYSATELADATTYFRDKANELATQVPRDAQGKPKYPSFEELAEMAADGPTKEEFENARKYLAKHHVELQGRFKNILPRKLSDFMAKERYGIDKQTDYLRILEKTSRKDIRKMARKLEKGDMLLSAYTEN